MVGWPRDSFACATWELTADFTASGTSGIVPFTFVGGSTPGVTPDDGDPLAVVVDACGGGFFAAFLWTFDPVDVETGDGSDVQTIVWIEIDSTSENIYEGAVAVALSGSINDVGDLAVRWEKAFDGTIFMGAGTRLTVCVECQPSG